VAIVAAIAWLLAVAPAQAATPGQNAKVFFTSGRDLNYEVYSMNADGSGAVSLSGNAAADMFPAVAPTGDRIAFTSFRDGGNAEIYVMNADGTGQTNLTQSAGIDSQASWSPDGQRIAFRSDRSGDWEIYVMNSDGSGVENVSQSPGVDDAPAWSPDANRIAFESDRDGNREVYVMNADGSGQVNLTAHLAQDQEPSWAPDGQRIAFRSDRDGNGEIYTMTQGGVLPVRLTMEPAPDSEPAWSPDGARILFRSNRDGNAEVYVMGSGGTGQTRISTTVEFDGHPDWQSVVTGFPRPKGGPSLRASVVPAYQECSTPTRQHGPPLASPSCNPPAQRSPHLTVGSPDANGAPATSSGFVRYAGKVGTPGLPDDSDIVIAFALTDVRCRVVMTPCATAAALSDYTGELRVLNTIQVTDRFSAVAPGGGSDAATVTATPFEVTAPCTATATAEGARCEVHTSANALAPGFARDGKRMLIAMGRPVVEDGGPDGIVATEPNEVFAVQGVFVP
jgi:Tol biopolymer transport system component